MRAVILTMVALATISVSKAQSSPVRIVADCVLSFNVTATGNSSVFDNRFTGCDNWQVYWETYGATPAATITFQQAPSDSSGSSNGTWATFSGTPQLGSNPSTATVGTILVQNFQPWVRVNVAGLTGTVRGAILGCKLPCSLPGGSGGGVTSDVNIVSSIPLDVVLTSPNPVPVTQSQVCTSWARINFSGTANAEIIPASGALTPIICSIVVSSDTATTIGLARGTGTNCGTGTTTMTTFPSVLGIGLDPQSNNSTFGAAASAAVCLNSSVSAAIGGVVFYRYQ